MQFLQRLSEVCNTVEMQQQNSGGEKPRKTTNSLFPTVKSTSGGPLKECGSNEYRIAMGNGQIAAF